ncbi:MAG: GntR family transcriptional regulator [Deltaproteobacteria bacterium]|nr:GntR family transcriptional regulator [Deltaproteobacteria bacterium]MBW2152973.1 GntR family transcriptional regulator [Deltaproteobacteria bacterium]
MFNALNSRHGQRAEEIIGILTEEILNGPLVSGDRLAEKDLAERFGTSRGPVREALRKLEARGLVCFSPNVGARVAFYTLSDFINLFLAREAMETMAARLAATSMTQQEKAELRLLLEAHEKELSTQPEGPYIKPSADIDFHHFVIRGSRNPLLFHILCEDLYPLLRLCRRLHHRVAGRGRRALIEHRRILEAIEDGDEQMAELTMQRHIAAARSCVETIFSAEDSESHDPELLKSRPAFLVWKEFSPQKQFRSDSEKSPGGYFLAERGCLEKTENKPLATGTI